MPRALFKLLAIVSLTLLFSSAAIAQINNRVNSREKVSSALTGDGSEFFRALLHIHGIKPVTTDELLKLTRYDDVIVIVLGNPNQSQNRFLRMPQAYAMNAIEHGGAALIASKINFRFPIGGISIENTDVTVECRANSSTFRGHSDCPFAISIPHRILINDRSKDARRLFNGDGMELLSLKRVVAGTPSYITLPGKDDRSFIAPLARYPDETYAFPRDGLGAKRISLTGDRYFSVGGEWHSDENNKVSRLVAMSSAEVFNNTLLYLTAEEEENRTDNLELCVRTIEYLQGPNRERKRCVFFKDGYLIEHFDDLARATATQKMPFPRANMVNLQKNLIDKGNSIIDEIQKKDAPNSLLNKLIPLRWLVLTVLWLAAISACLFIVRRAFGSRKPTDLPPPPTIASATSGPPGVFERRQKELLRRDNVYEPVRDLIRDFFVSVGVHGEPGPRLPKLNISRVVRKPDSLRLALRDLWRLAYGPPSAVSVSQWRDLEPYFERVQQAHVDKKWAFAFEGMRDS